MNKFKLAQPKVVTAPLVINDQIIRQDDDGRFSLNDIFKASGAPKHKSPSRWLKLKSTQRLIESLKMGPTNGQA